MQNSDRAGAKKRHQLLFVILSNMSRAAWALPVPVLIHARTSYGESHTSTVGICVGRKLSGMAQPAVESFSVPTGSDGVIRVDARMEGVRGSGRDGGDSCSTMSEPPCAAAAASLSRCRRRRNFRATFSTLQVAADEGTLTDKADSVSVAAVWVGLDDISSGGEDWE